MIDGFTLAYGHDYLSLYCDACGEDSVPLTVVYDHISPLGSLVRVAEEHQRTKHPAGPGTMPRGAVVIVGRTHAEARHWRRAHLDRYPELADAITLSTSAPRSSAEGFVLRSVFIAPGASLGLRFDEVREACLYALAKAGADRAPVYLPEVVR